MKAYLTALSLAAFISAGAAASAQTLLPKGIGAKVTHVYLSDRGAVAWQYKERTKGSKQDSFYIGTADGVSGPYLQPAYARFSDDQSKLIVTGRTQAGWTIRSGEKAFGPYDMIFDNEFDASGNPANIVTEEKSQYWWYHGSMKIGPFDDWTIRRTTASASGTPMYITKKGDGAEVTVGEQKRGPFPFITEIGISADGSRWGYYAREGNGFCAYINDVKFGPYNAFGSLRFAPSGSAWAYTARSNIGWKWFIYSEGFEAGPFDFIGGAPRFTPDGKTLVFAEQTGGLWRIHRGSTVWGPYDGIDKITWFPAKQEFAYQMRQGNDFYVCVGENKIGPYKGFGEVFKVTDDGSALLYAAKLADGFYAFLGETKTGPFDEIIRIGFLDGTQSLALRGRVKSEQKLFLDGKLIAKGAPGWCALSPDSASVAHWFRDASWHVMSGEKTFGRYDSEGSAFISNGGAALQCTGEVSGVEYTHLYVGGKKFVGAINRTGKRAYVAGDSIVTE